jgi:hypothetical protein
MKSEELFIALIPEPTDTHGHNVDESSFRHREGSPHSLRPLRKHLLKVFLLATREETQAPVLVHRLDELGPVLFGNAIGFGVILGLLSNDWKPGKVAGVSGNAKREQAESDNEAHFNLQGTRERGRSHCHRDKLDDPA